MSDLLALQDRLRKSVEAEIAHQEAESGNHRNKPKIGWREQPSQDHSRDDLDEERNALREYRHSSPTDRCATQPLGILARTEDSVAVERCQLLAPSRRSVRGAKAARHAVTCFVPVNGSSVPTFV